MIFLELISLPICFGFLLGLLWVSTKLERLLRFLQYLMGRALYAITHQLKLLSFSRVMRYHFGEAPRARKLRR